MSFDSPLDLASVRAAFPILRDVVYLNTGTYGLMPEPALQALIETVSAFERGGVACKVDLGAIQEEVRRRVAGLWKASPSEIAITRNATDGNNLALAGIDWQPGDEVLSTDEEHPSLQHPLLYLQKTKGIKVRWLPISPLADVMVERLDAAATPRTRLVAMSHVPCETGTRLPGRAICDWAASRGILSHLDGAQAFGAFPIDVKELGCDFYASNGHKWMGGPKGTGFFYARMERLLELKPAHVGAGSLEHADVGTGLAVPCHDGRRFEFGSRGWGVLGGFRGSLDWFDALGIEKVHRHIAGLSAYLKTRILARPHLKLLTPEPFEHSSGLTSLSIPGKDPSLIATTLREKWRIHTRMVLGGIGFRVSTAHFNTSDEVDLLLGKIDEAAATLD